MLSRIVGYVMLTLGTFRSCCHHYCDAREGSHGAARRRWQNRRDRLRRDAEVLLAEHESWSVQELCRAVLRELESPH